MRERQLEQRPHYLTAGWIGQSRRVDSTELPAGVRQQQQQGCQPGDGFICSPYSRTTLSATSFPEDLQNAAGPTNLLPPMTCRADWGHRATRKGFNRVSAGTTQAGKSSITAWPWNCEDGSPCCRLAHLRSGRFKMTKRDWEASTNELTTP